MDLKITIRQPGSLLSMWMNDETITESQALVIMAVVKEPEKYMLIERSVLEQQPAKRAIGFRSE